MHNIIPHQVIKLLNQHDPLTLLHIKRVSRIMEYFAKYLTLPLEDIAIARVGGLLHDIGKIDVDCSILHKRTKLSDAEFTKIRKHPTTSYDILFYYGVDKRILEMAKWHHERWDGTGYPDCISGEKLPLLCRMLSIVDAWEAMTGKRAYRNSLTNEEAINELIKGKGMQFDPHLVSNFVKMYEKKEGKIYGHNETEDSAV